MAKHSSFLGIKGEVGWVFGPPYLTLNVAPDVACALYRDSQVLASSVL